MKRIIETIILSLFIIGILIGFAFALKVGISGSEKSECLKWREQAKQFPLWYSTKWQREQCARHDLPLPK